MNKTIFDIDEESCTQESITLKTIQLFDSSIELDIPADMYEMPESQKRIYYPYTNRPECILTNAEMDQMTFQKMHIRLVKDQVYNAAKAVAGYMRQTNPMGQVSAVHFENKGKKIIAWFTMNLPGSLKRKHMKYVMEIDGYFALGTFTYYQNEEDKWENTIRHIFLSISETRGSR